MEPVARLVSIEDLRELLITLETLKNCACLGPRPRAKAVAMKRRLAEIIAGADVP